MQVAYFFLSALNLVHLAFCAATILRLAAGDRVRFPRFALVPFTLAQRILCASAMRLRASTDIVRRPERRFAVPEPSRAEIA